MSAEPLSPISAQAPSSKPPVAYSVAEAARALGISRSRLYEHMASGRIRFVKDGARRLVPARSLHQFVEALSA